jgi:hypothetical protein
MGSNEAGSREGQQSTFHRQQSQRVSLRFTALGDSASYGVGDPTPAGWRGWARILADAMPVDQHVSLCKPAVPGATTAAVRRDQLTAALDRRPHVASPFVGLNGAMRSPWDPRQLRADLLHCARALARARRAAGAAARYAAAALAEARDLPIVARVGAAYCSDIAVHSAEEVVQLHGGIGMTLEHPAHLSLKLAMAGQNALGTPGSHRAQLGKRVDLQA